MSYSATLFSMKHSKWDKKRVDVRTGPAKEGTALLVESELGARAMPLRAEDETRLLNARASSSRCCNSRMMSSKSGLYSKQQTGRTCACH